MASFYSHSFTSLSHRSILNYNGDYEMKPGRAPRKIEQVGHRRSFMASVTAPEMSENIGK